jgi:hypothetical protein
MVYRSDMPYGSAVAMSRLLTQAEGLTDTKPILSEQLRRCHAAFPKAVAQRSKRSKTPKVNHSSLEVALKADGVTTTTENVREVYLSLVLGQPGALDVMNALEGVAVARLRDSLAIKETHRTKTLSAFGVNSLKQMKTARLGLSLQETQFAALAGAWLHRVRIGSHVTPDHVKQAIAQATSGSNQVSDMITVWRCLKNLRDADRLLEASSKGAEVRTFISERIPMMWFYACSGTIDDRVKLSELVEVYNNLGLTSGELRINGYPTPSEREGLRLAQQRKLAEAAEAEAKKAEEAVRDKEAEAAENAKAADKGVSRALEPDFAEAVDEGGGEPDFEGDGEGMATPKGKPTPGKPTPNGKANPDVKAHLCPH